MAELPEGLLDSVKLYLNITWQDAATDAKITGNINRGMARLQTIAGASSPLDFTQEDMPRSLLFDYCRYANSQALEVFEKNFESELLDLNLGIQAPVIDALTLIVLPDSISGRVNITVMPPPMEGNQYVYKIGTNVSMLDRMSACPPPEYTLWHGIESIPATTGQDILIVEVNDEFGASRAGKITVN